MCIRDSEYTAPNTPQQNGVAESGFRTLWNMVRAANNTAELDQENRGILLAKCANTMTKMDNLVENRYKKFYGKIPKYSSHLRTFGEMGIVANRKKIQGKLQNKGVLSVFVGYAENHAGDVFKFFNTETKKIFQSRDVTWLNKMYGEYFHDLPKSVIPVEDFDDIDESFVSPDEKETKSVENDEVDAQDSEFLPNTDKTVWLDDVITEEELEEKNEVVDEETSSDDSEHDRSRAAHTRSVLENLGEIGDMVFFTKDLDGIDQPDNFSEAWDHSDPKERKGWRDSTTKEFKDMMTRKVWRTIQRKLVPKNRSLVKS